MGACESRQEATQKAFKKLNKQPKKVGWKNRNQNDNRNPFYLSPDYDASPVKSTTKSHTSSSSYPTSLTNSSDGNIHSDDGIHEQEEKDDILETINETQSRNKSEDVTMDSIQSEDKKDDINENIHQIDVDNIVLEIEEEDRQQRILSDQENVHFRCLKPCCRMYYDSQQHFQQKLQACQIDAHKKWIQFSLVPLYTACPECSDLMCKRYNVGKRQTLNQIVRWGELDISKLLALEPKNGCLNIKQLMMKDLVKIAYTCGTIDFVYQVYTNGIDGNKLYEYPINNKSMFSQANILMFELKKIALFMQVLGIIGATDILRVIEEIEEGKINHKFINNVSFGSTDCGISMSPPILKNNIYYDLIILLDALIIVIPFCILSFVSQKFHDSIGIRDEIRGVAIMIGIGLFGLVFGAIVSKDTIIRLQGSYALTAVISLCIVLRLLYVKQLNKNAALRMRSVSVANKDGKKAHFDDVLKSEE